MSLRLAYETKLGKAYNGDSLELLDSLEDNSVNLVMTSPPFALLRQKSYGNKVGDDYIEWLTHFAIKVKEKLTEDGSFVLDLGGAYERGVPVRSLYNYKVLIKFVEEIGFHLAEEFFWYNSSKLPSPIEWVNKRKIRAKDSVNTVWWFSKSTNPKADVRNVLAPYSDRMQKLLKDSKKYYDAKERPSGHDISEGFNKDNGGAIPSNLLQIPNSESNSKYLRYCKELKITGHPARFPGKLPEFFIKFLTDPGDTVLDIFGGSNTTGEMAELHDRRWLSCDLDNEYVAASAFRFLNNTIEAKEVYDRILNEQYVNLGDFTLV
ncbi:site-specific DNA-methyltransferase (cytosine-N4-specific) [Paenibacillus tianmuensis]|uniref:Methyltransferase n=1 Tax=Paenibacillus tianmuensis TaxID=624147 RepID=A0A1G4TZI2_9BACL|nr:site-specific DNA-methyltransferase [Paenibacillus tianmuensis]SCW86727.1 site-specific DNA-methyltransferase (cytosine-N4-specific) [Paenibacillus tianmuensis]